MDGDLMDVLRPLADRYMQNRGKVLRALAAGGSAAVYVVQEGAREFALKVYDPALLQGKNAAAELRRIELQRNVIAHNCQWLVQIHVIAVQGDECFIEMEYVPWDTLKKLVGQIPDAVVPRLLAQLVEAARFLEDKGIVHRDIKPENILVAPDFSELRLIDLGVVRGATTDEEGADATDHGDRRPFVATAQYSSPEYLFRLEMPSPQMWRALTFYQIGGVLHDMLIKRPLFSEAARTENKHVISMAVFRQIPDLSTASNEHRQLALLASHCLTKDPNLRLRLVTWERFVSPGLTGALRMRANAAQVRAIQQADRELQQAERDITTRREHIVRDAEALLKQELVALVAGAFTVVSFVEDASVLRVTLRDQKGANIHLALRFEWEREPMLNRGAVTLLAAFPSLPSDAFAQAAVAEIGVDSPVKLLCEAAIDRISVVVETALALKILETGSEGAVVDLVAKSPLK